MLLETILLIAYTGLISFATFSKASSVSIVSYCATSAILVVFYYSMNAFDVGLTEISIGTLLSFFFFYTSYSKVLQKKPEISSITTLYKVVGPISCIIIFLVFLYVGYLLEEVSLIINYSQHYIQSTYAETKIPNSITAILASYRSFDTMGETLIIAISSFGIFEILKCSDTSPQRT